VLTGGSAAPKDAGVKEIESLCHVFAANRELFRRFDSHFDPPAGTAQQRDQDGTVREELRESHGRIHAFGGLDDDGLIGSAAED
jgi:hypothetical protein